jgi:hypothetical protein
MSSHIYDPVCLISPQCTPHCPCSMRPEHWRETLPARGQTVSGRADAGGAWCGSAIGVHKSKYEEFVYSSVCPANSSLN